MIRLMLLVSVTAFPLMGRAGEVVKVGTFDVDASPKVGTPLAYDPTKGTQIPLSCRGIVIVGSGKPIVLCAVDWIGIANESYDYFRESMAKAAGTTVDRVAVHTLHQHDAPRCDFSSDRLLAPFKLSHHFFDEALARDVVQRASRAIQTAITKAVPITHIGMGEGRVEKVASNRRILGPDGKVKHVRWTATKDAKVRAFPAGVIDPMLKMITLWNGKEAVAALTYYATHPQSYYRTGMANPDFPGMARNARQKATKVIHVHFNGAGGNIGAGKWNDGSKANRQVLADRVAAGVKLAWESQKRSPINASDVKWQAISVKLPAADHLDQKKLTTILSDKQAKVAARGAAASHLAFYQRCKIGTKTDVTCLTLGKARLLHLPGELFVEYQLAAQKLRPDLFVAMAAYGDYGPGYIGTKVAYTQGGYETSNRASRVSPKVEAVLMGAIEKLLHGKSGKGK